MIMQKDLEQKSADASPAAIPACRTKLQLLDINVFSRDFKNSPSTFLRVYLRGLRSRSRLFQNTKVLHDEPWLANTKDEAF